MILINAQKKCKNKKHPKTLKRKQKQKQKTENTPKTNLKYIMHADIFF